MDEILKVGLMLKNFFLSIWTEGIEDELFEGQNKGEEALEYVERIRLYYETLSLIEKNKSFRSSLSHN